MNVYLRLLVFILGSLGILRLSWQDLRQRRAYAVYRLLAFEAILLLILANAGAWFQAPLSLRQLVSWLLLAGSLGLAIHSFAMLRALGKPQVTFDGTTRLVRSGAYRYIRHPLYTSLLLFAWGAFLKDFTALSLALTLTATACLYATARAEELEDLAKFGDDYARYMQETRMFIPFVL